MRLESAVRPAAKSRRRSPLSAGTGPTELVSETLFSQVQRLFERTLLPGGINLEECALLIALAARNFRFWPAHLPRELSELARTFLRRADDQLYVGNLLFALVDRTTGAARSASGPE